MRIGITQSKVYVVPKSRRKGSKNRRRPNLAREMFPQMQKALDNNTTEVERRFNEMLFDVAAKFNR